MIRLTVLKSCAINDILQPMYTFLIACIPVFLLLICCLNKNFSWKSFIPAIAFGFLVAFGFYICRKFMIFTKYTWTTDPIAAVLDLFIYDALIPVAICMAVFFIFDRSSMAYKAEALAPLFMTFYAIMVPFYVLTGDDAISPFMIYGKPLLYAGMPVLVSVFASSGVGFIKKKVIPLAVVFFILALLVLLVPGIVEALWYYKGGIFHVVVAAVFAGISVAAYIVKNVITGNSTRQNI